MKPTSLSTEFYTNLYNEIIRDYDFDPDCDDAEETQCSTYIDVENFQGFYICLKATYELNLIDDSFDHAFGTEYGWHMEIGELIDIEEVTMYDEDGNDVSDLFDYDAFFEQFKKREVKFMSGTVIKSGDIIIAHCNYNRYELAEFLYRDSRTDEYICKPLGSHRYSRSFKRIFPNTEENRRNAKIA